LNRQQSQLITNPHTPGHTHTERDRSYTQAKGSIWSASKGQQTLLEKNGDREREREREGK